MPKRSNYITWEQYFMEIARLSARRSKDPNTQVGACIVSPEKRILGIGYNGLPNGVSDDLFPWDNKNEDALATKYPYVVHAEANAILNVNNFILLKGASLYVTLMPCNECAKLIIQAGIKTIIYLEDKYPNSMATTASLRLFKASGIKIVKYEHR